ncbi:uncharacterized protein FMAN_14213 [Fusarium mangiferae]|uniref:Uncharacterized protein n=1 Tax=Fusarium mangiferae TaxID=192010 RepID=A0A1L7UI98_FUSMA|nr:uncharacterized protein FMAN_14213 [Fusarium mangiferae]CVL08123.1 uncharacterized protein FMAN_14213 [Fusarium mangiferae]
MDAGLRLKKHIAEAAARGLTAAMCLKRLRVVYPPTARQPFPATVALAQGSEDEKARATTGALRTVSAAVMEVEIYSDVKTLPKTHPLAALKVPTSRRYMSPLKKLTLAYEGSGMERLEMVEAYAVPPWHNRVSLVCEADRDMAIAAAKNASSIVVATSASDGGSLAIYKLIPRGWKTYDVRFT